MPVYKDKQRGTWYVKFSRTENGKRKQVLKRGFTKKADAVDWEHKNSTAPLPDSMTFSELADKYFKIRDVKESTEKIYKGLIKNHFIYNDLPINKINKPMMTEWYLSLDKKGLKKSSQSTVITIVKSIFKFGENFYDLPNPSAMLSVTRQKSAVPSVWSPQQFDQFISVVDLDYYKAIFCFLYYTGCRKSEALGLHYDDFNGNTVHIQRNLKTEYSNRTLTLAPALIEVLKPVLARCSEEKPVVFPINYYTLHIHFKDYIRKAGVSEIRIHDLRHSFATNAIGGGMNIVAVSKYMGHSSITQTLNTYTHLFQKADQELVNYINGIIQVSNTQNT